MTGLDEDLDYANAHYDGGDPGGVPVLWVTEPHRCRQAKCTRPAEVLIAGPGNRRHFCADHLLELYPFALTSETPS